MDKQEILKLEIQPNGSVDLGFYKEAPEILGQLAVDAYLHDDYKPITLIIDALAEFCSHEPSGKLQEDIFKKTRELAAERRRNKFRNYN